MTEYTHDEFFISMLVVMEIEPRLQCRRALAAVAIAESPGTDPGFNPLNVVQDWPGAVNLNSVGVKRYRSFIDGVLASAQLFSGSHWVAVRNQLVIARIRQPMLAEFTKVYGAWDSNVSFNFSTEAIDARRAMVMTS